MIFVTRYVHVEKGIDIITMSVIRYTQGKTKGFYQAPKTAKACAPQGNTTAIQLVGRTLRLIGGCKTINKEQRYVKTITNNGPYTPAV